MGKRRFAAMVVVSLALHAIVGVWVRSRPQPPVPTEKPTEIELVELPPPTPPPPAAAPEPEPVRPAPKPAAVPRPPRPAAVAAVQPAPVLAPIPPPPEPTDHPTADSPMLDAPRAQPLRLSATLAFSLDAGEPLREEDQGGIKAPTISKNLVGDLTRETLGRGKVDRGLVHPYYSQLGKALLKNWDADRAVSSAGLKGLVEQTTENAKVWNNIWQEKAESFGKSGSAFDAPVNPRAKPIDNRLVAGTDLGARKEVQKAMAEQMRATRRAQIRVVQDGKGKLLSVELVKPSNDANVDRQAITDVRAAAESLPPPPIEAMSGKQTLVSIWEFELVISITPPVPTFSFEFDEVLGFVDARMPLDRRIYKKVRLVAVE